MPAALDAYSSAVDAFIWLLLRTAIALDGHRRWSLKLARRLRGSLMKLWRRLRPAEPARHIPRPSRPWNRTPPEIEHALVCLHLEQPRLGAGQLGALARRVLGFRAARETIRKILLRRADLTTELREAQRREKRRIDIHEKNHLWGMDLTLVWLLGFFPIWIVGIVDYHGSRIIALERLALPRAAHVSAAVRVAAAAHGTPKRILTDRGSIFRSLEFEAVLLELGVEHTLTKPAHPWTNGRVERLFRTFKETVFQHIWAFSGLGQINRFCRDFRQFYNRDRPHSRFRGRTPDEVHGERDLGAALGRVHYFDGLLRWYRFG